MAEQQYANYEDKLLNDTIRFENGNFVWGSNSEIIPENEIDDVLAALSTSKEMQSAINSLSNLDTNENKIYTDSLKNILESTTAADIENMSELELIQFNKTYDLLEGIDTTYAVTTDNLKSDLNDRLDAAQSAALVDNLRVVDNAIQVEDNYNLIEGLQNTLGSVRRPWIDDALYQGIAEESKDFSRDIGRFTNTLGLGAQSGEAVGEGVVNLFNFLDYIPRQTNDRIQELFWNKLLGATEWQGGFGESKKADKSVPIEVLGMDTGIEIDPNSLFYHFINLEDYLDFGDF